MRPRLRHSIAQRGLGGVPLADSRFFEHALRLAPGDWNGVGMAQSDRERPPHEPATLYSVMREAIDAGLQKLYVPENEVPHSMLVLLMQINEDRRRARLHLAPPSTA